MKVLIAEDDLTSRLMLTTMLRAWGYDPEAAEDGSEAWDRLQQPDAPRLVILDWNMPGMDGLELIRRTRALDLSEPPYIIILTSRGAKRDMVTGLSAGANDYIAKPYDHEELRVRVEVGRRMVAMQALLAQQKESLRESEAFTKAILDNLPVGIAVNSLNSPNTFQYMNDNFPAFYRTTREQLADPGSFWSAAYEDPEFREKIKTRVLEDCASGEPTRMVWTDVPITRKGEPTAFITARNIPLPDQGLMISTIWDVTERKRAEEALRDSNWRLESIIEGTHVGTWEWNIQTGEAVFNETWAQLLGYTLDELATISIKTWEALVHPDDMKHATELLARHFAGELPYYDCECRVKHKDGHWVWVQDRGRFITCTPDGKPLMMFGTHTDITERKQVEEALRESEEHYRLLFNSIHDAVFLHGFTEDDGMPGHFLQVNEVACQRYGYSREEWLRMRPQDLDAPEGLALIPEVLRQLQAAGHATWEGMHQTRDGRKIPVEINNVLFDYHGAPMSLSAVRDITLRKQAEASLLREQGLYKDLVNTIPVGMYRLRMRPAADWNCDNWKSRSESHYSVEMASDRFCEITGLSRQEFEATAQSVPDRIHPDDYSGFVQRNTDAVASLSPFNWEGRMVLPDQRTVWVHFESIPRLLDNGEVIWTGIVYDITERKQAVEALRESEERFRKLLQNVQSVAVQGYSPDGTTQYWNQASERLYGYPSQEAIGRNLLDLIIPPEMRADVKAAMRQMAETGQPIASSELSLMRKDGSLVEVFSNHAIVQVPGRPQELFCLDIDLSECRQAEAALRATEARQAKMFAHIGDVIAIIDQDGVNRFKSPNIERWFGWKPEDVVGASAWDNVHPEDLAGAQKFIGSLLGTPNATGATECRYRCKDGSYKWIEFTGVNLLHDPDIQGILGNYHDITERKQADKAAKQELALNNAIIDSIPGTFYMLDENGRYVRWNTYQREEIVGQPEALVAGINALGTIHPDDRAPIQACIANILENGAVATVEGRVLLRGGPAFRWLLMTGRQMMIDGSPFLVGIGIDITERKQAEEEKAKLEDQLQQAQKMESVGRLAGGVAHDFNNMLGVIIGHAEMALDQLDPAMPLHDALEEILKAAERSADLTRQLLAFARKQTVNPKVLDLNATVASILQMLRRLIGEDIELAWKPGPELWPIKMDPSQVDQILANLSVNARDAIAGVGQLTIHTGNVVFDESYCRVHDGCAPGDYVLLAVSDTGCGMSQEILSHVFEPFFTTKDVGQGTGLGLSMVYGAVKQNRGFINVYSEPGQGTIFKIYLPRAEAASAKTAQALKKPAQGTETVLLAEDEEAILKLGTAILEKHGYTVLAARTPDEALALAEGHAGPIQLLVTDVVMPGMNGKQLMTRLKALRPGIKVLFMSGYTSDIIAHQGVIDEGVAFLQKPFSVNTLTQKVREVLQ